MSYRVQIRESASRYRYRTVHTEKSLDDATWAAHQYLGPDGPQAVRVLDKSGKVRMLATKKAS